MSTSEPNESSGAPPRRRKRNNYSLLVLAAGMFIFAAAAGTLYYALRPVTLRIAVGPPASDDQKLIQALAQTFARDGSPVRLSPIITEGAAESIALLAASKADLAVARGDLDLPANAESVAILRKNVVVLWAPSGLPPKGSKKSPAPKIKSLDDLAGRRVGVIGRTQANVTLLRVILTESGVNPEKVAITQFGTDQIADMTRDPTIDAFMAVGPLDSKITTDAIAATPAAMGEAKFLPAEEAGANIDGTERTFLEKYSDYLWGGILLLSGLGSAGAWLRQYFKRDEREQSTLHRDNLLAMISKVRQAESSEELTAMQCEVDGILRETLDSYDDGAIEEGDLSAIGLVLEQFHHAVADRRVAIGATAPDLPRRRAL